MSFLLHIFFFFGTLPSPSNQKAPGETVRPLATQTGNSNCPPSCLCDTDSPQGPQNMARKAAADQGGGDSPRSQAGSSPGRVYFSPEASVGCPFPPEDSCQAACSSFHFGKVGKDFSNATISTGLSPFCFYSTQNLQRTEPGVFFCFIFVFVFLLSFIETDPTKRIIPFGSGESVF